MRLRIPIVFLLILFTRNAYAQDRQNFAAPNYELIEKATTDKASNSYYPKLLARFKRNDTTLTAREVHLLYYGRFFQEGMANPFGSQSEHIDSIRAINAKQVLTDNDRRQLMSFYLDDLDKEPLDLNTLYALYATSTMLHDPTRVYYDKKLEMLVGTILATGDGITAKSGWHVGTVADEYAILGVLGLKHSSQSMRGHCDYMALQENSRGLTGVYFDIGKILQAEMNMLQPPATDTTAKTQVPVTKKKK